MCSRIHRAKGGVSRGGHIASEFVMSSEKNASLLATVGGVLLPRLAVSATNAYLRRPNSPLQAYYKYMAAAGLRHGIRGGNRTFLPRLRRPLLAALGPATGFGEYELGLSMAAAARDTYKKSRGVIGKGMPARFDGRVDGVLAQLRKMVKSQQTQIAKAKLPQIAETQPASALHSAVLRNMSDGMVEFLRNPTLRMTPRERRWTAMAKPRTQGRLTLAVSALRGGTAEAMLTPYAPVSGFLNGAAFGAVEFLPDAAMIGQAARGNVAPLLYTKSKLIDRGVRYSRTPTKMRRAINGIVSAYDPNVREALHIGKDIAAGRDTPLRQLMSAEKVRDSTLVGAVDRELAHGRRMSPKAVVDSALPGWIKRYRSTNAATQPAIN